MNNNNTTDSNKTVHTRCQGCANYTETYVQRMLKASRTKRTIHGCVEPECSQPNGFKRYKAKPISPLGTTLANRGLIEPTAALNAATTLEGSAKSSTHYQVGAVQPIEYCQMVLTPEEFIGAMKFNVIKYVSRMGHKDAPVKEAAKIEQYAKWLRMALEGKTINPMVD